MNLRQLTILLSSCLISLTASANCDTNNAGQDFCIGDTVYTHYDVKAKILKFNRINRPVVMVLEGKQKGEHQTFETNLLYSTKQDCILEFCIGTLVRRHEQSGFSRQIVGINKVLNTLMYENMRSKKYAVKPAQLIAKDGFTPAPQPPGPSPKPPVPNPSPAGDSWSMDDFITVDGIVQSQASVGSLEGETTLILSCLAPSPDMKLKVKMDISYSASVMEAIHDPSQLLVVQLVIDSEAIELTNWQVEGPSLIAQIDALYPDEVSRIRKGAQLKLVILSDKSSDSDEEVNLYQESFSLKGSGDAIKDAQDRCIGDTPKI